MFDSSPVVVEPLLLETLSRKGCCRGNYSKVTGICIALLMGILVVGGHHFATRGSTVDMSSAALIYAYRRGPQPHAGSLDRNFGVQTGATFLRHHPGFQARAERDETGKLLGLPPSDEPRSQLASLTEPVTRRGAIATGIASAFYPLAMNAAKAAGEEDLMEVYFGCGCFWHVQHEFAQAEKKFLNRGDLQLTALSGYAGGNGGTKNGKVCYHNAMGVSDYGSLGHAEVVRVRIPPSSFSKFATEYIKLFDADGNRPDQFGDRGLEYRNVVGIPGGKDSPHAKELIEASRANGDKLDFVVGKGSDPDRRAAAFIMDSTKHPFYQAEVYHQFHDGFNLDENYPDAYNNLGPKLLQAGKMVDQGCPNGMFGIGVGGL